MDKPIYQAVLDLLAARKGQWRQISADSGVPYSTLCKVAQGHIESPSVHLVQKLYDHLSTAPGIDPPLPTTAPSSSHEAAA